DTIERLATPLALAVRRARRRGAQTLATFSLPAAQAFDPTAVAFGSRLAGESWFVFEQPERGRAALAGLGEAVALQASGAGRFARLARRWRELCEGAVRDSAEPGHGAGPVAVGGFAFADEGGGSPHWAGFEPASLIVPELTLARAERDGALDVRLTLAA